MRQRPHPRRKLGSETVCLRLSPLTVQHSAVLVVKERFSLLSSENYCYFMHTHVPLYHSCLLLSEWFCVLPVWNIVYIVTSA